MIAGKTTAVGMLSGLIRPTAGDCSIMGHSMVTSAPAARQCLGFCPQQNTLFGRLTAREHLLLFAAIKGLPGGYRGDVAAQAADDMLEVAWPHKTSFPSWTGEDMESAHCRDIH